MVDNEQDTQKRSAGKVSSTSITTLPDWLWQILRKRGIESPEDIDYRLSRLVHPDGLKGLDAAATLIIEALEQDLPIIIVGDYDVDGATGTALAIKVLKAFGSTKADYYMPNRFAQGYGLSPPMIDEFHARGIHLAITVDNGITSHLAVDRARALGIKIIITDHHLPGNKLPDADAIINPNQPGCNFRCKSLAGVGVIFYLLSVVRTLLREKHWFIFRKIREPVMSDFLDLVALGTIADMTGLDYNNRVLVESGLRKIRQRKASKGIACLLQLSGIDAGSCSSRDIGFSLAPPLNAAGRLDSIDKAMACILASSWPNARQRAQELIDINNQRKKLQAQMARQAAQMVEQTYSKTPLPELLLLHHADWHQGITGVVAGNIKDSYQKSCIVLTSVGDKQLKGSGRANENLHLRNLLLYIQEKHPEIFVACGGHARAAGMTIHEDQLEPFRQRINDYLHKFICQEHADKSQHDGLLPLEHMNLQTAQLIEGIGPWGMSFEEPVFCDSFTVLQQSLIASRHLRLTLAKDGVSFPAIAFNIDLTKWPNKEAKEVQVLYHLHINRYQKQSSLQLTINKLIMP